ncbi:DUF4915 domain-containing protein [Streptomyces sp. NBC_01187]|uniref:DUF4915 domain-containing protein n=1 Tax=Streptomyces sp. NBC_01187 TaxID=2903766 RepID=UPI00386C514D|nr:TIGR03032 family protein [Streptomyces sp. NBC_01187]
MSEILVSVHGNTLDVRTQLVVVDTDTATARRAPFDLPDGFQRYMGLAVDGPRVSALAVYLDNRTSLVTLDRTGDGPTLVRPLPGVMDGHSMLAEDGDVHAVSSGTDELVRFSFSEDRAEPEPEPERRTVWRASDEERDTHHINCVLRLDGNILVSAFGPSSTGYRRHAMDGYIFDVTDNRPVLTGVAQPHSVTVREGLLYYCASGTGEFRSEKGTVIALDGYLRGACWLSDDLVCIGTSAGRAKDRKSHSAREDCAVWIVDVTSGAVVSRIPMGRFGPEIYDIVLL